MFYKLRKQLTIIYTLITWFILTVIIFFSLLINEKQLDNQIIQMFQSQIYDITYKLESENKISITWLAQMESSNNLIINISENNIPFFFQGSWTPETPRNKLIEKTINLSYENGVDIYSYPVFSEKRDSPIFTFRGDKKEKYYSCVTIIPTERGWKSLVVIKYTFAEENQKIISRIIFIIIDIIAIIILFITNWLFIGKLLKPIEENQKKQYEFVAAASHELRSPLTVIQASISAMISDKTKFNKFSKLIEKECKRMRHLIDDMLILANADAKTWTVHKEIIDMDTILIELYDMFFYICLEKKLKLSLSLPDNPLPNILGDKERIKQVLSILIDNALNYTPENGKINIKSYSKNRHLFIEVSDNGKGIPDNKKEHIFDRFYRVDSSRNDKKHFGLGLSIALELIKLHNGNIICCNTKGGGTTFIIEFNIK